MAPETFENRQSLKEEWRGIKDMPTLVAVSGISLILNFRNKRYSVCSC